MVRKLIAMVYMAIALSSCIRISEKKESTAGADTTGVQKVDPKHLISCEGVGEVKLYDTCQDLVDRYGEKALSEHENNVVGEYSVIWEGQPSEISIIWKEKIRPFKNISYLKVNSDVSFYQTATGMRLHANKEDLQKANGDLSVTFKNFNDPEHSGEIISFNGGDIQKTGNCLGGTLQMINPMNIDVKEIKEFNKEKTISTAHRLMNRMNVDLTEITVGKPLN